MKKYYLSITVLLLILSFASTNSSYAQKETDKTESPYFFVKSDDPSVDQLPLKATSVEANIAGVIADVCVKQVYKNEGKNPIEATYLFPASTRAAVYGLQMTVGDRIITAEIKEKEKARKQYEKAKKQGKRASLLEQHRPNVFQMNVANIMPNETIEVELTYTETLIPEEGIYEFVYPTVVGPRYQPDEKSDLMASSNNGFANNPYLSAEEKSTATFQIQSSISAGLPIARIASPSHKVTVNYAHKTTANISLDKNEQNGGNRDYILRYELKGKQIASGLLLHEGDKENFFMMMVQPPKRIAPKSIPPREYIFVVDVSGSMNGFPLSISKKLFRNLASHLNAQDKFNLLLFAGKSALFSKESVTASTKNIEEVIQWIDGAQGSGGTQILPALQRALQLKQDSHYATSIVVITDGYVTVEPETFDLIRNNLSNANVFAFGIGSSVNRHLIEGMAYAGQGEAFIVTQRDEAEAQAERLRRYISRPILTDISLEFDGFNAYDVAQQSYPDLLADRPIVVFGKYKGKPKGTIALKGKTGKNSTYVYDVDVAEAAQISNTNNHKALRSLWARERIRLLSDYNELAPHPKQVKEITQLGLKYNLLTKYTSFLAIDKERVNPNKPTSTVKQPLPLPKGVSNRAIGLYDELPPEEAVPTAAMRVYPSNVPPPPPPPPPPPGLIISEEPAATPEELEELILPEEPEFEEEAEIFGIVEQQPEFVGGQDSLFAFLVRNIKYPQAAKDKKVEGTVYVGFVIDKDGSIKDVNIKRGLKGDDAGCHAEAVRVVKMMPKWKPGKQRGKLVEVNYTLPIKFKLENSETKKTPKEEEEVFQIVDNMPEFVGGQDSLFAFLVRNIKYPQAARDKKVEGTVYVDFVIDKDGSITDVSIKKGMKGDDAGCHAEAMRVVKMMPKWKPGTHRGNRKVKVAYTLPIKFKLEGSPSE